MSRSSKKRTGKFALKIGAIAGATAFVGMIILVWIATKNLGTDAVAVRRFWGLGLLMGLLIAAAVTISTYVQAGAIGTRITDLALVVAKIGRRGAEVRVRIQGRDEVTALGRAVQYLASDLQSLLGGKEDGGTPVTMDPQVRELRDRTLPEGFDPTPGYEMDGALEPGSRGGLDYFDAVLRDDGTFVFLVSGEGQGPMAVVACRMARDELLRALKGDATPRKALAHTNRVLHRQLPHGACAKASLLQIDGDNAKLYQAGARTPLLICVAGQVQELSAEGLALGLDEGSVFEKGLRPEKIAMATGLRLVLANEGALRMHELLDLISEHSPKHTAPFMNLVLGGLVSEAGEGGLREDMVLLTVKKS